MQKPEPYEVHSVIGEQAPNGKAWLTSVVLHALLILAVLFRPVNSDPPAEQQTERQGQPVALDPRPEFQEEQPQTPPPPAQIPEDPIPLGPDSERPDEPPREAGPETPVPELINPPNEPEAIPDQPAPTEQPRELDRIPTPDELQGGASVLGSPTSPFAGLPRTEIGPVPSGAATAGAVGPMGRTGISSPDNRGWRQSFPQASGQCVPVPDLGVNADGSPVLASVIGVVRDQRGRPLPNAHLQIMGAPFATFADGAGNYRLEFDPKLLARCRSQVVRVSAEGYRTETLNLAIGRQVQSDDVVMRRR